MAAGYMPESCGMSGKCNCYFVVEGNVMFILVTFTVQMSGNLEQLMIISMI